MDSKRPATLDDASGRPQKTPKLNVETSALSIIEGYGATNEMPEVICPDAIPAAASPYDTCPIPSNIPLPQ